MVEVSLKRLEPTGFAGASPNILKRKSQVSSNLFWAPLAHNWVYEINRLGDVRNRMTKRLIPKRKYRWKGPYREVLLPTQGRRFGKPNTRYKVYDLIQSAFAQEFE